MASETSMRDEWIAGIYTGQQEPEIDNPNEDE